MDSAGFRETPLGDIDPEAIGLEGLDPTLLDGLIPPGPEADAPDYIDPATGHMVNESLASLIATLGYRSPPTSELIARGQPPTVRSQVAQTYVSRVVPWLDILRFYETLGPLTLLSPQARLIVCMLILVGSLVFIRPPKEEPTKPESPAPPAEGGAENG